MDVAVAPAIPRSLLSVTGNPSGRRGRYRILKTLYRVADQGAYPDVDWSYAPKPNKVFVSD